MRRKALSILGLTLSSGILMLATFLSPGLFMAIIKDCAVHSSCLISWFFEGLWVWGALLVAITTFLVTLRLIIKKDK